MKSPRNQYPPLEFTELEAAEIRAKIKRYKCIAENGCWTLPFSRSYGYSNLSIFGGVIRGHRAAFAAHIGPIPDGFLVMHSCDNRGCVNPAHLELGTQADNLADCRSKGRAFDQTNPAEKSNYGRIAAAKRIYTRKPRKPPGLRFHKLTDEDVAALRKDRSLSPKPTLQTLAKKYHTSVANVSMICSGKSRSKPLTPAGS